MKIRFDHIMMHTSDMQKSIDFLREVAGMELENTDEYPSFRLAYMVNKETNIKFELRENYGYPSAVAGNLLGHFAFYVDDVQEIIRRYNAHSGYDDTKFEEHVSVKHGKKYLIFTCWTPDHVELSFLQKVIIDAE